MLEFDDELAVERFLKNTSFPHACPRHIVLQMVRAKHDLHEKLHPAFLTWLDGGIPQFEYEGFTFEKLMDITRTKSYFNAITDMDRILKDPEEEIPFYRHESFVRF